MNDIVVGMGEALWDVLPEGKKIGGAPANFAYHVSQFGLPSCVVSAVGDDALGKEIIENFTSKGLNQFIAEVPYPTGTVQVEIDQAGVPQYEIKENVAWDNIPYTAHLEAIAEKTKAVCFGSLAQRNVVSRNTINRFLDAMPQTEDLHSAVCRPHIAGLRAPAPARTSCCQRVLPDNERLPRQTPEIHSPPGR